MAITVILFDALNIGTDDLQYGKNAVLRFLRTLHAGDPVAVYSIRGPQVRVVHDFNEDTASLIAAANNLSDSPGVQIRARSGYFAASVAALRPEREQSLKLAAASPLEGAAIGIKVNVQSNPLQFYGQEMSVEIDPRDLLFAQNQGRMRANVDPVFAQLTKSGAWCEVKRRQSSST